MNDGVSVIIPARDEPYLQQTIDGLFDNAAGEIEVIVVLDGYWPKPALKEDKRLIIIHRGESWGMRHAVNAGARIASSKFIMKLDAHCAVGQAFDTVLKKDCRPGCLCVPRRYPLNAEKWERRGNRFVDYMYITFPYVKDDQFGYGMHGRKWIGGNDMGRDSFYKMEINRANILIDEIMTYQGSCYFLHRDTFLSLGCLDAERYYNMYQETQELGMKIWLSGGRVLRNKNTWFAHLHKASDSRVTHYKGMSKRLKQETERYSADYWMGNRWPGAKRTMKWFVQKFWPIPGWPDDWEDPKYAF